MNVNKGPHFFQNANIYRVLVIVLLIAGFLARMIDLTDPPLDFHSTRQLRAAIITRSLFLKLNPEADPEHTAYVTNPALLDYVGRLEPPITESIVALIYLLIGQETLWVSRIVTGLFWCLGGLALFLIARRLTESPDAALISLGFFLFTPFGIIASRSFQPDILMIASMLWALYLFLLWLEKQTLKSTLLAGAVSGFAILVKPYAFFVLFLTYGALILFRVGLKNSFRNRWVWLLAGITGVIPAIYYLIINPGAGGFYQNGLKDILRLVRQPSFYLGWASIIDDVISSSFLIIGLAGALLFEKKHRPLIFGLWIGYVIFGLFLSYFIYTHDYYSLMLIPVLALSLAMIARAISRLAARQDLLIRSALIIISLLAILYPVWTASKTLLKKDYRGEPAGWRQVGDAIPEDMATIALTHDYGHYLAYFGYRMLPLWPYTSDMNRLTAQGHGDFSDFDSYFQVTTAPYDLFLITQFAELESQPLLKEKLSQLPVYAEGPGYILYDLR
jgi:4-amino-4-deoxy-L-arabinose transferase-like glycosyltransferase